MKVTNLYQVKQWSAVTNLNQVKQWSALTAFSSRLVQEWRIKKPYLIQFQFSVCSVLTDSY